MPKRIDLILQFLEAQICTKWLQKLLCYFVNHGESIKIENHLDLNKTDLAIHINCKESLQSNEINIFQFVVLVKRQER